MTDDERNLLKKHEEALFGTELNPEIGIVSLFKVMATEVAPILKFWKDAKWPVRIFLGAVSLALTGWLVEGIKTVLPFLGGSQ